jgi:ADP-ribosylglycohydrolase
MVGLLPERPQRGKPGIKNLGTIRNGFEALFDQHCRNIEQGRVTGEKALQSFLVAEAQTNARRLVSLNRASAATDEPVELCFVTDEIALPIQGGKVVCDVLALRRDGGRCTPVLLELKDSRQLTRLVEQLNVYAKLMDEHAELFARLFGVLLGEDVRFDGLAEKWLVWPRARTDHEPRGQQLMDLGIRVVGYAQTTDGYSFQVGPAPTSAGKGPTQETRVASTGDPRISALHRIGTGEGFATFTGVFDGKPALIVDSGTLNDLMDEDDRVEDPVLVRVFHDDAARTRYIEQLRRQSWASLGSPHWEPNVDRAARVRGCLLGGAIGDALGAPVEFMSLEEIRRAFGPDGVGDLAPAYGRVGAITDDTQMTLFAAEGMIRALIRYNARGICHPPGVIHHALLRWLHTQGERSPAMPREGEKWPDGWLVQQRELFSRRAPGMTCLGSLKASERFGDDASNDSKGCGAIMRIAPIGLLVDLENASDGAAPRVFTMACESARSTHGHPTSTVASGFFALAIAHLARGTSLLDAITEARVRIERVDGAQETLQAVDQALALAASDAPASPESVEQLGGGWIAEEALGISLFCALRAQSFDHGVRLAVNHGGDSDSTGSLTGQLLGTLWGAEVLPARWLEQLELRDIIEQVARDLVGVTEGDSDRYWDRYPGW